MPKNSKSQKTHPPVRNSGSVFGKTGCWRVHAVQALIQQLIANAVDWNAKNQLLGAYSQVEPVLSGIFLKEFEYCFF
jgi:hypothetical protein